MSARIVYETEPCGRCGGSGRYSRCERWGTTCFDCGSTPGLPGSGKRKTKRARAAREAIIAKRAEIASIPTADLRPGMMFLTEHGWRRAISITDRPDLVWRVKSGDVERSGHMLLVETKSGNVQIDAAGTVVRGLTAEEAAAWFAFARTLPGVTVVEDAAAGAEGGQS